MPATSTRVTTAVDSPVGPLTLVGDGNALSALWFEGHRRAPGAAGARRDDQAFGAVREQLDAYFAGELREFDLELTPDGTAWQLRVWDALRAIPYGETRSYGQIASQVCTPAASRAVGMANGRNPISIIVPCHRVIGANGKLTGYGGGLDRKQALLALEAGILPLS